ncbi:hypothetical protein A11A3_01707 [Alcanivorax hongdengensis A-11-3]|uniref:GGDEF domain-containing protein n=2 Tax=Alcanivorax hongdengensis TaxID=519051 RepID=L0WFC3_9GAMM|nr:hypothetical protein A11A3_01707 [Alcanivorax hongdengensis A-11-3]
MALWMVARRHGDELILLRLRDGHYGLQRGERLCWQHTYCCRMMENGAPTVVADTRDEPAYQSAPINQQLDIGAYIGLPLTDHKQRFFGTLCALNPSPVEPTLLEQHSALEHQARLISFLLGNALSDLKHQRITDFIEQPHRCEQTGLLNETGWQEVIRQERRRCRDFGLAAVVMRLQGPTDGDPVVIADSLAALLREQDSICHHGGNGFSVLLCETDADQAPPIANRIRDALNAKQLLVRVSTSALDQGAPPLNE